VACQFYYNCHNKGKWPLSGQVLTEPAPQAKGPPQLTKSPAKKQEKSRVRSP